MSDEQKVWLGDSFEGLSCSRDELSGYAEGVQYLAYTAEEARKFAWQMIATLAGPVSEGPYQCSFCGNPHGGTSYTGEVIRIVMGPGKVAICQECCALCNDILNAMVEEE